MADLNAQLVTLRVAVQVLAGRLALATNAPQSTISLLKTDCLAGVDNYNLDMPDAEAIRDEAKQMIAEIFDGITVSR
ncbi:MAG: hypothetical protein AAFP81_19835 [Pseudomonadota bacterium]